MTEYKFGEPIHISFKDAPVSEVEVSPTKLSYLHRFYIGGTDEFGYVIPWFYGEEKNFGEWEIKYPTESVFFNLVPDKTPRVHFAHATGVILKKIRAPPFGIRYYNNNNYNRIIISPTREINLGKDPYALARWGRFGGMSPKITPTNDEINKIWKVVLRNDRGDDVSNVAEVFYSGEGICSVKFDKESYNVGGVAKIHCQNAEPKYLLALFTRVNGYATQIGGHVLTKSDQVFEHPITIQNDLGAKLIYEPYWDYSEATCEVFSTGCEAHTTPEGCFSNLCFWYGGTCHNEAKHIEHNCEMRTVRWRPAPPGVAIANMKTKSWGTFGCVVLKGGDKMILSCNHVLALLNQGEIGDKIYQGSQAQEAVIATLAEFIPIRKDTTNKVDCALAKPTSEDNIVAEILYSPCNKKGYVPSILPTGVMDAYFKQRVKKSGALSGVTFGEVITVDTTVEVGGTIFEDMIITDAMGRPGDSGSLLLDVNTNKAVGLLTSGTTIKSHPALTTYCSIKNILEALGITLYTAHPKKLVTFKSIPEGNVFIDIKRIE